MSCLADPSNAPAWGGVLQGLGLRPSGDGYRDRKIRFRVRSGWGTFESNGSQRSDPLRGLLLAPDPEAWQALHTTLFGDGAVP